MSLGKSRKRPDGTVYWDVMVALSVLLGVGLVFFTYSLFSVAAISPHYPKPGYGELWAYWAENPSIIDQPLIMFTATLFLLTLWIFVLFLTIRGSGRRRMLAERTAIASSILLISTLVVVIDDLMDIVTGEYSLTKWEGTIFSPGLDLRAHRRWVLETPDRYRVKIGDEWAFLPDADTIRIGARDYRLWGIDALQAEQRCSTEKNRYVPCGEQAYETLLELMSYGRVSCYFPDQARYPGTISCRAGRLDVAEWMVRRGYAFPTPEGRHRFGEALREARARKWGVWNSTFLHPRKWRDARCKRTAAICELDYAED